MWDRKMFAGMIVTFFALASFSFAEDYQLQYFLGKVSLRTYELSKREKAELLNRIEGVMEQAQQIRTKLVRIIQEGEAELRYQEGKFWMSRLDADQASINIGAQHLKLLRARPMHLVASIQLYKSLKDLSSNLNAYNNTPAFSRFVGDLAPEIDLWADPVFFNLYLLPLAKGRDGEAKPGQREKKTDTKGKRP